MAAEVAPVSGDSGLGRATAGLASALTREFDVTIAAPRHHGTDPERFGLARRLRPLEVGGEQLTVYDGVLTSGRGDLFLIECGDRNDMLCRAALALAERYGRWPDVVHAQDWRTAPVLAMAATQTERRVPATVACVHQSSADVDDLRAAIAVAGRIVAPSPQYARDLQSETAGGALAADFAAAGDKLRGILDGIDGVRWNPRHDSALPASYDARDPSGKAVCKAELQRELGLPRRPRVPLVAALCSLTGAGGGELLVGAAKGLGETGAQIAIVGAGDADAEGLLGALTHQYPTRFAARIGGDAPLARRILGGADFLLIPNRFDPNAVNRLACLRYGTVPILSPTSGLIDTIIDFDERTRTGSGILCDDDTERALVAAVRRAVRIYASPAMSALVERAMAFDLTWTTTARSYANLYRELIAARA